MKFGRNVLHVNMHRLTVLDFQFDIIPSRWRPCVIYVEKCCRLVSAHAVSASCQSTVPDTQWCIYNS